VSRYRSEQYRRAACDGKEVFTDAGRAHRVADLMRHRRKRGASRSHRPIRAYRCTFCGHWHLTGNERKPPE
jgi:hypothetical protein